MSGVNRAILGVLGLSALLGGALVILIATNLLDPALRKLGTTRRQPIAADPILPPGLTREVPTPLLVIIGVGALLVALLAVWWIRAQFPRSAKTPDFRLQSDVSRGSTVVTPAALSGAIGGQLRQLPGVLAATAVVRGAVQAPQLIVRVTVDDRSDVAEVVGTIFSEVGDGLALALGSTVDRLRVLVAIDHLDRADADAVL